MRIMFVGDVVGTPGRRAVRQLIPALREQHQLDVVIVNGENATNGIGLGERHAGELLSADVDGITLGNHALRQRDIFSLLNTTDRIVRPANLPRRAPGHGLMYLPSPDGSHEIAVINLLGSLYLDNAVSPFEMVEALVEEAHARTPIIVVDMHAEATSEKVAMGVLLAGRVSLVVGTHTHVQTSDARILAGHTAYITDVGMTGPHDSVIGVRSEIILKRMTTGVGARFETAEGGIQLEAVVVDLDPSNGRATSIDSLRVPLDTVL